MIPLLILAYCCCRKQRRNHKMGKENKTLKALTTSRHSLNESSSGAGFAASKPTSSEPEAKWKKASPDSQSSSGVSSVKRDLDLVRSSSVPVDHDSSTFDSSRSPVTSSASGGKTSPTGSKSSSSPASWNRDTLDSAGTTTSNGNNKRNSRHRYQGIYYTHEPIKNAPLVDFPPDAELDVEINHRNTEV